MKIAENNGKFVGVTYAHSVERGKHEWFKHKKTAYLETLFILEQYRGEGIGTDLCKLTEKWAINAGYSYLSLRTSHTDSMEGQEFAKKQGLKTTHAIMGKILDVS